MPYTGLLFLIGSISISALPPFNGFMSEWLTYQSLLLGFNNPSTLSKIITPIGGAPLALTGALAAACFVKAFGISFLGMPRSEHAEKADEQSFLMIIGMAILAIMCLITGVFPSLMIEAISPASFIITGTYGVLTEKGFVIIEDSNAMISTSAILISLLIMGFSTLLFIKTLGKKNIVYGESWDCGIPSLTPRMQYSATAFTKSIRMIFKKIYLPRRDLKISYIIKPLFVKSIEYRSEITPFFEKYIYEPFTISIGRISEKMRLLQSGSLHLYLGYILLTLIILLIFGI